jgi:hypothetical protein
MKSYLLSVLVIVAAAVPGTVLAWLTIGAFGASGVLRALATAFLAMVFSVGLYAGYVALGRALKIIK